jgi:serine/threonine protein kinase
VTDEELIRLAMRRGFMTPEQVEDCKRLRQEILEAGFDCGLLQAVMLRQALTLDDVRALSRDEDPNEEVHTGRTELLSEETKVADLALARGSVTLDQYRQALQVRSGRNQPLDEILVELGFLPPDVRDALRRNLMSATKRIRTLRRSEIKFGEQLVQLGFLSPSQLERGLKLHQAAPPGQKIGETLVSNDLLTQSQLDEALLRTARIPPIAPPGYHLEYRLGTGFTGAVFKGTRLSTEEGVAVKLYYPSVAADKGFAERFKREVAVQQELNVSGVPKVVDAGIIEPSKVPFVSTELVRGVTLAGLVHARTTLAPAEALKIIADVARILHRAGDWGLSHRALSPRNVILSVDGRAHVTDWTVPLLAGKGEKGLSQNVSANVPARAYQFLSPEAIMGEPCDERSDIYVLGAMLYYCVAGRPPFVSESVSEMFVSHLKQNPDPPPVLQELIAQMMAKDQSARFPSLPALETELRRAASRCPRVEPRPFIPKRMSTLKRHARTRRAFVVGLFIALLLAGGYKIMEWQTAEKKPAAPIADPSDRTTVADHPKPKPQPPCAVDVAYAGDIPAVGDACQLALRIRNVTAEVNVKEVLDRLSFCKARPNWTLLAEDFRGAELSWSVKPGETAEILLLLSGVDVSCDTPAAVQFEAKEIAWEEPKLAVRGVPKEEAEAWEFLSRRMDLLRGWQIDRFTNDHYLAAADFLKRFPNSRYAASVRLTLARIYESGISTYSNGKRLYTIRPDLDKADSALSEVRSAALQPIVEIMRVSHACDRWMAARGRDPIQSGELRSLMAAPADTLKDTEKDLVQRFALLGKMHGNTLVYRMSRFNLR